jgi:hypothetical protein
MSSLREKDKVVKDVFFQIQSKAGRAFKTDILKICKIVTQVG